MGICAHSQQIECTLALQVITWFLCHQWTYTDDTNYHTEVKSMEKKFLKAFSQLKTSESQSELDWVLDSTNFGKLLAPFCIQVGLPGSNLQQMLLTSSVEFCRQNRQIAESMSVCQWKVISCLYVSSVEQWKRTGGICIPRAFALWHSYELKMVISKWWSRKTPQPWACWPCAVITFCITYQRNRDSFELCAAPLRIKLHLNLQCYYFSYLGPTVGSNFKSALSGPVFNTLLNFCTGGELWSPEAATHL